MLSIQGISTYYGKIPMLQQVTAEVNRGEVVCVLGANGVGKTTLLKTILGLVKPVAGAIHFNGVRIDGQPSHKIVQSGIAMVPQDGGMFPKMTVEENLRFGAYFQNDQVRIARRMGELYERFPRLKERSRQKAGTLSGGERCMLAIARGLLGEPQLLLMDEPSLGLSPLMVEEVFKTIEQIKSEGKLTILLVEQSATKALNVSDRGYIMQKGAVVMAGSRAELLESPVVQQSYLQAHKQAAKG
ncbi:MAG TPA: ABC transporter ATP-binding protein [Symbiobacteriaceae bacterium]|nr:ABC transporter ATP-binding protein [Symbiobacteriaceae bacterium]